MRAILDVRVPSRNARGGARADPRRPAHRSAVLLDIDGTLAPIVRHAADAHVPEATRTLLIEIARRYRVVGCVSGRRAAHRPPDRRDRDDRLCRQPRGRAAAPRRHAPRGRPGASPTGRRACARSPRACTPPEHQRMRVRSEDKDAIAAFHWRGAPDEEAAAAAVREIAAQRRAGGLCGALGAQGARGAPAGDASTRALASPRCCAAAVVEAALYVGDDTTDLDAFRGLRALVQAGELEQRRLRGGRLRRSASRAGARGRPDGRRPRRRAGSCSRRCCSAVRFVDFLRTTVLLSAGAATALAAITVLAAGRSRSRKRSCSVAVGWWVIAAAIGLRLGRRAQTSPPIARLLAGAKASTTLPELPPQRDPAQPPVAAAAVHAAVRRPRVPGSPDPRHRGGLRDHLGAGLAPPGRGGRGDRGARRGVASTYAAPRRCEPIALHAHARLQGTAPRARQRRRHLTMRPRRARVDVLIVSLGSTAGLRTADEELRDSLRRAGATRRARAPRPPRRAIRTLCPDRPGVGAGRTAAQPQAARSCSARLRARSSTRARPPRCCGRARARSASTPPPRATGRGVTACGSAPSSAAGWPGAAAVAVERGRPCARRPRPRAPATARSCCPSPVEPSGPPAPYARHRRDHLRRQPAQEGSRPRARGLEAVRASRSRRARSTSLVPRPPSLLVRGLVCRRARRDGVRALLAPEDYRALLRRARVFVCAPPPRGLRHRPARGARRRLPCSSPRPRPALTPRCRSRAA